MQSSRFIYMGTQSHTHLNEDDITEHLHLCDTSELNLKCCGKKDMQQMHGRQHVETT